MIESARIIQALGALAQEHRLAAYRLLVEAGANGVPAGKIAEQLGLAPSSLSFHLAHLERSGLIVRCRAGRSIIYAADYAAMTGLIDYLTENCCGTGTPGSCAPVQERNVA